jgi:hypothetical protein
MLLDVYVLAMCMENMDVIYGDTRDRHGRERFLQFILQEHYEGNGWLTIKNTNYYPYRDVYTHFSSILCSNNKINSYISVGTRMLFKRDRVYAPRQRWSSFRTRVPHLPSDQTRR